VGLIILGNPLSLQGKPTEMSNRIERFLKKLRRSIDVEVVLWDERYVSKYAMNRMRSLGISGKKEEIDRIAAAIILDEYLESKRA
jgi:putative Holliday junction resolvase